MFLSNPGTQTSTAPRELMSLYSPSYQVAFRENLKYGWDMTVWSIGSDIHQYYSADDTPKIAEDVFNERYARPGVFWREGMSEAQADLLAENYDRKFAYSQIMKNVDFFSKKGLVSMAGIFAGNLPDPTNYIGMGKPFMAARYAKASRWADAFENSTMLYNLAGRKSSRAIGAHLAVADSWGRAGALGGSISVGALAVKANVYQEQMDLMGAALMIGGGYAAGSAFSGMGSVAGLMTSFSPRMHRIFTNKALSDIANGKSVDVGKVRINTGSTEQFKVTLRALAKNPEDVLDDVTRNRMLEAMKASNAEKEVFDFLKQIDALGENQIGFLFKALGRVIDKPGGKTAFHRLVTNLGLGAEDKLAILIMRKQEGQRSIVEKDFLKAYASNKGKDFLKQPINEGLLKILFPQVNTAPHPHVRNQKVKDAPKEDVAFSHAPKRNRPVYTVEEELAALKKAQGKAGEPTQPTAKPVDNDPKNPNPTKKDTSVEEELATLKEERATLETESATLRKESDQIMAKIKEQAQPQAKQTLDDDIAKTIRDLEDQIELEGINKKEIGNLRKRTEEAVRKQQEDLDKFNATAADATECLRNSFV